MPGRRDILGVIRFRSVPGQERTAVLFFPFSWQMQGPGDAVDRRRLETLHRDFSGKDYSPGDGEPGAKLLDDAARALGGEAEWLAPEDPPLPWGTCN
jgi:hypothetical protein